MNRCSQCGAILPENSVICIHCGTNNTPRETKPAESAAPPSELDFFKPALKGGLALGVLSGIPLVSCFCCIWVLGGGGLATWLVDKQRTGTLKYGDGALAGGLSGIIGGVVATVIGVPLQRLLMTPERVIAFITRLAPNLPPEAKENITRSMQELDVSRLLIQLVVVVILYGLFAMIGGCLTVAILNRKKTD
jgi:hypothetical protein